MLIADSFVFPFEQLLDYSLFSVRLNESAVLEDPRVLRRTLDAIPAATRARLRANGAIARPAFRHSHPLGEYAADGALEPLLFQMWLRRGGM